MKFIFIILGVLSLVLGVIGIVVPLLPTTPFVLLSAALFIRSSPRLYEWLVANPVLGEYIRNYHENKSIPMRAKISSIALLWISILCCIFLVVDGRIWLQLLLLLIAIAVTWHILSLGSIKRR